MTNPPAGELPWCWLVHDGRRLRGIFTTEEAAREVWGALPPNDEQTQSIECWPLNRLVDRLHVSVEAAK